jgi:hypothetical protein
MVYVPSQTSKELRENGFAICDGILSQQEIQSLRASLSNYFKANGVRLNAGVTQPNAAVKIPEISWLGT